MRIVLGFSDKTIPEGIYYIKGIEYCCDKIKVEMKNKRIDYKKINYCPFCGEEIIIKGDF